jgi:ATP-dependent Clp protease adaptor protein ClpS
MAKLADALEEELKAIFSGDTPWVTIVWDDPVIVSTGSREEMEHDVARLHEYGLWATLQRGDQI